LFAIPQALNDKSIRTMQTEGSHSGIWPLPELAAMPLVFPTRRRQPGGNLFYWELQNWRHLAITLPSFPPFDQAQDKLRREAK
jgi:hypothetical protein